MVCALNAARLGVLIQSREALSLIHSCRVLAIDKTGTLTKGELSLQSYTCSEEHLQIAMHCAQVSLHPVSRALVAHAHQNNISLQRVSGTEEHGKGVCVELNDKRYFLGRASWLSELGVEIPDQQEDEKCGFGEESSYWSHIFADTVRAQSKEIITQMKDLGFSIMMLQRNLRDLLRASE